MSLTVVVGGNYGSEGKGKLVSYLSCQGETVAVVRCGGPNAGHTADGPQGRMMLRQLPSGAMSSNARLFLAAGMELDLAVLKAEIDALQVTPHRLTVDANAVVIDANDADRERQLGLGERIGSTLSGTGAARARKVERGAGVRLARDCRECAPYLGDVARELAELRGDGFRILVEGSQGAGLSLHHGAYPYVTSRDTTAAGFLAEAGLPPTAVTEVVVVLRTYPIRVAGNSGPLDEIGWPEVARRAGYPVALEEYTTVTGRLRRVGEFDWDLAAKAVRLNGPTSLALHGVDYLAYEDLGKVYFSELSAKTREFIHQLETRLGVGVRYVFTGPDARQLIDRGVAPRVTRIGPGGDDSRHDADRTTSEGSFSLPRRGR